MEADPPEELLSFRSVVDDPRLRPDPFALAMVAGDVSAFRKGATELGLNAGFIRTMSGLVVEAFRQLDALPRSDGFWEGTNRRPTGNKLSGFCEKLLRDRPGDIPVLWMRAGVASVICLYFHPTTWMRLMAATRFDLSWPIGAALVGEALGSYDTVRDLVAVLTESGRVPEAMPELARMKQKAGNINASEWAGKVIDELSQVRENRNI